MSIHDKHSNEPIKWEMPNFKATDWNTFKATHSKPRVWLAEVLGYKQDIGGGKVICLDSETRKAATAFLKNCHYPVQKISFIKHALEHYVKELPDHITITRDQIPAPKKGPAAHGAKALPSTPAASSKAQKERGAAAPQEPISAPVDVARKGLEEIYPNKEEAAAVLADLLKVGNGGIGEVKVTPEQFVAVVADHDKSLAAKKGDEEGEQWVAALKGETKKIKGLTTSHPPAAKVDKSFAAATETVAPSETVHGESVQKKLAKPPSARARKYTADDKSEAVRTAKASLAFMEETTTAAPLTYAQATKAKGEAQKHLDSFDRRLDGAGKAIKSTAKHYRDSTAEDALGVVNKLFADVESEWTAAFRSFKQYADPKELPRYQAKFDTLKTTHQHAVTKLEQVIHNEAETRRMIADKANAQELAGEGKKTWADMAKAAKERPAEVPKHHAAAPKAKPQVTKTVRHEAVEAKPPKHEKVTHPAKKMAKLDETQSDSEIK